MTTDRAWLDGLVIGDPVAVWPGGTANIPTVRVMIRREKRGRGTIVVTSYNDREARFDAETGYERIDGYGARRRIGPVDDQARRLVAYARDRHRLSALSDAMRGMNHTAISAYDADAVSVAIAELERLLGVP